MNLREPPSIHFMKQLLNRLLLVASFGLTGVAMGQYGTTPDFTVTDIEGNTHQL